MHSNLGGNNKEIRNRLLKRASPQEDPSPEEPPIPSIAPKEAHKGDPRTTRRLPPKTTPKKPSGTIVREMDYWKWRAAGLLHQNFDLQKQILELRKGTMYPEIAKIYQELGLDFGDQIIKNGEEYFVQRVPKPKG